MNDCKSKQLINKADVGDSELFSITELKKN